MFSLQQWKMLINVRNSDTVLRAYTNGGHQDSTQVADLPGFFKVWFNPKYMLNILSFADVRKKFRVTMDTSTDPSFNVHLNDGKVIIFVEIRSGLYLLDTSCHETIRKISGYSFLSLVKGNKANFTRLEIKNADLAKDMYRKMGMPGYQHFFNLLKSQYFRDCPITTDDAKRAVHIYGQDIAMIKGKTTRERPSPIGHADIIELPKDVRIHHSKVTLSMYYQYAHGIHMNHSISKGYEFRTIDPLLDKPKANNQDTIRISKNVINIYESRGLTIKQLNSDNVHAS